MRADVSDMLRVGDFVTLTEGIYAGMDGEVMLITHAVSPWAGRALLRLPCPTPYADYWHPFWSDPMDEAEWRTTRDTAALERALFTEEPAPSRRSVLYACALVRRVWQCLTDETREAIAAVEAEADHGRPVRLCAPHPPSQVKFGSPAEAAERAADILLPQRADQIPWDRRRALSELRRLTAIAAERLAEPGVQLALVRDLFANPFRSAVLQAGLLAWNHGTIPALARLIYDEHRFDEMPVLGDALEDAGCDDEDVLGHCRQPLHTRGCWLLDAILGLA